MIAFGLFLNALMASGIITATPIYPVLKGMLVSALATLGWCLVFNVPRQNLWQCIVITGLGYGLRNTLLNLNMSLVSATFFFFLLSSGLGIYLAKRYFITPKAVIVPGLVCMMPGITAYKAMVSLIQLGYYGYSATLFDQMMHYFMSAMFVIGALVFGLSLPATIFYRKQPIV